MILPSYQNLAKVVVKHSLEIQNGHRVIILAPSLAKDLILAMQIEIIKAGGHPTNFISLEGSQEILLKYGTDEQLRYVDDLLINAVENFDALLSIRADYNTRKIAAFDQKRVAMMAGSDGQKKMSQTIQERNAEGELNWVICPFPCEAYAQEADMDIFTYSDFIEKALYLDKEDPIVAWKELERRQDQYIDYLNKVEEIQIIGEDTDLTLSVKGRNWINCSGKRNLPDGEVYTSPIEDSVNGYIRFTYPGIYYGQEIENIYLEFKDGKVTKATASKGQRLLDEILKIENADILGEFAIGNNFGITRFTKNILFDEKIGGTIHCALGLGPKITGSKNESAIHWDILKNMRPEGSKIEADGEVIYQEAEWKI